ncbi:hypothetical protein DFH27DRAFT_373392 [Peziza echinospora]|nr:hypothetical protein DFH27DRAFT_373392 [Peziza echinospora]
MHTISTRWPLTALHPQTSTFELPLHHTLASYNQAPLLITPSHLQAIQGYISASARLFTVILTQHQAYITAFTSSYHIMACIDRLVLKPRGDFDLLAFFPFPTNRQLLRAYLDAGYLTRACTTGSMRQILKQYIQCLAYKIHSKRQYKDLHIFFRKLAGEIQWSSIQTAWIVIPFRFSAGIWHPLLPIFENPDSLAVNYLENVCMLLPCPHGTLWKHIYKNKRCPTCRSIGSDCWNQFGWSS